MRLFLFLGGSVISLSIGLQNGGFVLAFAGLQIVQSLLQSHAHQ